MEKSICDLDNKLVIRHETLKKIRHRVEIIRQILDSPAVYCRALVEVVRRRRFSHAYQLVLRLRIYLLAYLWASRRGTPPPPYIIIITRSAHDLYGGTNIHDIKYDIERQNTGF